MVGPATILKSRSTDRQTSLKSFASVGKKNSNSATPTQKTRPSKKRGFPEDDGDGKACLPHPERLVKKSKVMESPRVHLLNEVSFPKRSSKGFGRKVANTKSRRESMVARDPAVKVGTGLPLKAVLKKRASVDKLVGQEKLSTESLVPEKQESSAPRQILTPAYQKYAHLLPDAQQHTAAVGEEGKRNDGLEEEKEEQDPVPTPKISKSVSRAIHGCTLATCELPLPQDYRALEKLFLALENTVMFMRGQKQDCIYHRIKRPVENITGRTFDVGYLTQIEYVVPGAYKYEPVRYLQNGERIASVKIDFNFGGSKLNVFNQLQQRKREFRARLVDLACTYHQNFLIKRGIATESNGRPIIGWHPEFDVSHFPRIPSAWLSSIASFDWRGAKYASQLLHDLCGQRTEDKVEQDGVEENEPPVSKAVRKKVPEEKVIEKARTLLERIKAKEKQKAMESMYGESEESKQRRLKLARLVDISNIIHFLFMTKNKCSLGMDQVKQHILDSSRTPLSGDETRELIEELAVNASEWCTIIRYPFGTVVKINKAISIKAVHQSIQNKLDGIHP